MKYSRLNPQVHSAAVYEASPSSGERVCYAAKLIYLISGELSYTLGEEKRVRMSPGNILYIPAGLKYSIKSKYMRAAVVTFDLTDEFSEAEVDAPSLTVAADAFDASCVRTSPSFTELREPIMLTDMESERDTFVRMYNIFISENGSYLAELSAMLKLILLKLSENTSADALPSAMAENLDSYIRENIHDEISNTELGAIFGYHPFYISQLLKEKRGVTLHQYVLAYRFKYASALLRFTDKSIADIADAAGFTDAPYFTKTFKARFGVTPKEYRNKFSGEFI